MTNFELTKEQTERLEVLKKQHTNVHTLAIKKGTDWVCAFLKNPSRNIVSFYLAKISTDPVTAREVLLQNCWIEGDERLKTEDSLFYSTFPYLDSIMEVYEGVLKKS